MKKTVFFLTGDYWHPTKSISPLIPLLFPEDAWQVIATERPKELLPLSFRPDLRGVL